MAFAAISSFQKWEPDPNETIEGKLVIGDIDGADYYGVISAVDGKFYYFPQQPYLLMLKYFPLGSLVRVTHVSGNNYTFELDF